MPAIYVPEMPRKFRLTRKKDVESNKKKKNRELKVSFLMIIASIVLSCMVNQTLNAYYVGSPGDCSMIVSFLKTYYILMRTIGIGVTTCSK